MDALPARIFRQGRGHSTRLGTSRHLADLKIGLAAITQAGDWKSPRMYLQGAENNHAEKTGMARATRAQGSSP